MSVTVPEAPIPGQAAPLDPIPGIINFRSINLLAGASGVGKTCLTAWLCTRFRDALPIFDHATNPVPKIGFICADRGWPAAFTWFSRAGFPDVCSYSLADDPKFNPKRLRRKQDLIPILDECIAKLDPLPRGSLVIVDPVGLFLGGNLNDYFSCAIALLELRRLVHDREITVIGLAHAAKQKQDKREVYADLADRIMGSAAQHGYGDTQMYLAKPSETGNPWYTFLWRSHVREEQTFKLGRDRESGLFIPYDGDLHPPYIPPTNKPLTPEALAVLSSITLDPAESTSFGEALILCEALGRSTVHKYLTQLVDDGQLVRVGHGRYRRPQPS